VEWKPISAAAMRELVALKALAAYSGFGLRKLYDFLSDPVHPLPHYRVGGKILVRRSEFDAWIARYRQCGRANVDAIVDNVLKSINSACAS
jgi:excisionase family DNA binding protein